MAKNTKVFGKYAVNDSNRENYKGKYGKMGLASSQARFLFLTSRNSRDQFEVTRLANQKTALASDMQKVTRKYNDALNAKVYKWSPNQGVTLMDINYSNLMRPSEMNQNKLYMVTDTSGRVVVDAKYRNFAKQISPEGKASTTNWEKSSIRTQLLADVTGFSRTKIADYLDADKHVYNKYKEANSVKIPELNYKNLETAHSWTDFEKVALKAAGISSFNVTRKEDEGIEILKKIGVLFGPCASDWEKLCDALKGNANIVKDGKMNLKDAFGVIRGNINSGKYGEDLQKLICFQKDKEGANSSNPEDYEYRYFDYDTAVKYKDAMDKVSGILDSAHAAEDERDIIFTAEQEISLDFYDSLFSAIFQKGWVYNSEVNDSSYLNEMFQNNLFMLTTVDRTIEDSDEASKYRKTGYSNHYDSAIADNVSKIVKVNDSSITEKALAECEHEKSLIQAKELKVDQRMKILETRIAATQEKMKSIKSVIDNNIEKHMKIFDA